MLHIPANDRFRYCDGLTRRSFLQAGVLGLTGFGLSDMLRTKAQAAEAGRPTPNTACIFIWLDGGPTHMDTYDLKPDAPEEYRGPFRPIDTNVPGMQISPLMTRQAQVMDKLSIVRSIHHRTGDHFAGAHWMITGYRGSNAARREPMYPGIGAIASRVRGANQPGMPAYVSVPYSATVGIRPGYNSGAYLGSTYNPFQVNSDPNRSNFSVQNLSLPTGVTMSHLSDRRRLLEGFDVMRRDVDRSGTMASLDRFQQEAFELISGPRARHAFDITAEDPRTRDRYGRHTWGQSCLLARRLVEAGVTFVTLHMGGWDNHAQIERAMNRSLPILDRGLASLVEDLTDRGMYDQVAICVCGEFGRTPRVNGGAGRDHWGQSGFAVMGGGGIRGGQIVGSTTSKGERPNTSPATPGDMLATLYHSLGIDTRQTFIDNSGRPHPVLNEGTPIRELV